MNDLMLQQIERIPIYQHNKEIFRLLCGLDLEICRPDGSPLYTATSRKDKINTNGLIQCPLKKNCKQKTLENSHCTIINPQTLTLICHNQRPEIYTCPDGFKMIIIPIVFKEEVVGLVFTKEKEPFRFHGEQCRTTTDLLYKFINDTVKNEFMQFGLTLYQGNSVTRQKELLNRAVDYIKRNYQSNDLTLQEVAQNNGISYHYLSRLFKKELDTTFAQFRNKVRMEAAKKLLKKQRLSVSQISFACGFDDPGYFCKVFKSSFGASPVNFRTKKQSKSRLDSK
ncbi:MAG TPA: hypothetical protein DD723_02000 [Candidatus Omnitrophica bacterium]|nr:MAG: hypothetical protein A2Z81_09035 [Omnitrophica WOR_2 bacterium GWA2_45_18]HBR14299.1 hypothetical protein [Candidatus Omnitrophota bacterium]